MSHNRRKASLLKDRRGPPAEITCKGNSMRALGHLRTGLRIAVLRTLQRARILQHVSVRLRASPCSIEDQDTGTKRT